MEIEKYFPLQERMDFYSETQDILAILGKYWSPKNFKDANLMKSEDSFSYFIHPMISQKHLHLSP